MKRCALAICPHGLGPLTLFGGTKTEEVRGGEEDKKGGGKEERRKEEEEKEEREEIRRLGTWAFEA